MTCLAAYRQIKRELEKAGCDSPAFDACCLLEALASLPRGHRPDERELEEETWSALQSAARRRAGGEPLQYILGEWDFLNLTLAVGEGALIPRSETELLCETAAKYLGAGFSGDFLDLCAGTGCVGLGVCSLLPACRGIAVEFSDAALPYLRENLRRYPSFHIQAVRDNVLEPRRPYPISDAVLCNPPYIPSAELPRLQDEVRREPREALDGGEDGLLFYRALADTWVSFLKPGGLMAAEIGYGQRSAVADLFRAHGLRDITAFSDASGIPRVVCAVKP